MPVQFVLVSQQCRVFFDVATCEPVPPVFVIVTVLRDDAADDPIVGASLGPRHPLIIRPSPMGPGHLDEVVEVDLGSVLHLAAPPLHAIVPMVIVHGPCEAHYRVPDAHLV